MTGLTEPFQSKGANKISQPAASDSIGAVTYLRASRILFSMPLVVDVSLSLRYRRRRSHSHITAGFGKGKNSRKTPSGSSNAFSRSRKILSRLFMARSASSITTTATCSTYGTHLAYSQLHKVDHLP